MDQARAPIRPDAPVFPPFALRIAAALVVFSVFMIPGALLLQTLEEQRREDAQLNLERVASAQAVALQIQIDRAMAATQVLAVSIHQHGGMGHDFDTIASDITRSFPMVDGVFLAKDAVVSHAFPLMGNEKALGHDLMADPARASEARAAMESGALIVAGPFNLIQGGVGLFGRLPVFLEESGHRRFWGFSIVLVRSSTILAGLDLEGLPEKGVGYALWRSGADGKPFFIAASPGFDPAGHYARDIPLPGGHWTLSLGYLKGPGPLELLWPRLTAWGMVSSVLTWLLFRLWAARCDLERSNRNLTARLQEREVLIREIHHRVKNNLQVVMSLLDLQAEGESDSGSLERLEKCRARIRVMALSHELIFRSQDLRGVDMAPYLERIVGACLKSFGGGVAVRLELVDLRMAQDKAVLCGMLVNELATNSLKHAFVGVDDPEIRLSCGPDGAGNIRLVFADNGRGMPDPPDSEAGTLGLLLARSMVGQLGGEMAISVLRGVSYEVVFPRGEAR